MSDNPYAPLSQNLVKLLTDKIYDKRKQAALDVEKQVRELYQANQTAQLEKLISVLRELAMGANSHVRKGGLIGLAATAIALKSENVTPYTGKLIEPVLACFNDPDLHVRYYACESLYNIVKICKGSALSHFDTIFDVLWKLSADTDQNVRSGAELLDRLVMDIVVNRQDFDIANLMVLLRERIYVQTSSSRRFLVSWLNTLLTTPTFNILPYLAEVSDGLFKMLGDSQPAVRDVTETVLGQFLQGIKAKPDTLTNEDRDQMVNVLIVHAHEQESPLSRQLAMVWMDEFLGIYKEALLKNLSSYLKTILPFLENDKLRAKSINEHLMALVKPEVKLEDAAINAAVDDLLKNVKHEKRETRVAVLNWIRHLHATQAEKIFVHMHKIFPVLLTALTDSSDQVLLLDLHLLSDVCQSRLEQQSVDLKSFQLSKETLDQLAPVSPFLIKFTISLLEMFRAEPGLVQDRGVLITRQLCLLLEPAHIYRALCVLLLRDEDITFVTQVVGMLHGVLLTATELFILRDQLKELKQKETVSLFECIFRCWCHRPVSLLGLCLLSQNYDQASRIALLLSKIDITVEVLIEIDKLVSMIESPVLAYVRMDLLSATHQKPLSIVLSSLLMLLPQSEAFHTLYKRLQAVPALTTVSKAPSDAQNKANIDFEPLFVCFQEALNRRQAEIRRKHRQLLMSTIQKIEA